MREVIDWVDAEERFEDTSDESDTDSDEESDSEDDSSSEDSESEDSDGSDEEAGGGENTGATLTRKPGEVTLDLFCKIDDVRIRMLTHFPRPRPPPPPTPAELELIAMKKQAEEKEIERQRNLMLRILKRLDNQLLNGGWIAWVEHLRNLRKIAKMRMRMQNMCVVVTFQAWQKMYREEKKAREHAKEIQQKLAIKEKEAEARLQKSQQESELRLKELHEAYARPPMEEVGVQTMNEPIATQTDEGTFDEIKKQEEEELARIELERMTKLQQERERKEREQRFQKFLELERLEDERKKAAESQRKLLENGTKHSISGEKGPEKLFAQDSLAMADDGETKTDIDNPLNVSLKELDTYSMDSLGSLESNTNSPRDIHKLYKHTNQTKKDVSGNNGNAVSLYPYTRKQDTIAQTSEATKSTLYTTTLQHSYDIQKFEQEGYNFGDKYKHPGILETSPKKKKELIDSAINTLLGSSGHSYHPQAGSREAKAWMNEGSVPIVQYK